MEISSTFNSGMQGLQRAQEGLDRNAETVAKAVAKSDMTEDVTTAMIESEKNVVQAQASAKVVTAADEMVGTLIDMKA